MVKLARWEPAAPVLAAGETNIPHMVGRLRSGLSASCTRCTQSVARRLWYSLWYTLDADIHACTVPAAAEVAAAYPALPAGESFDLLPQGRLVPMAVLAAAAPVDSVL